MATSQEPFIPSGPVVEGPAPPLPARPTAVQPAPTSGLTTQDSSDIEIVEAHEEEPPTESHELAQADHDLKGAAQIDHDSPEVKNMGWNEPPKDVPNPLVGGISNEELWTLLRRFNKQMYHVKKLAEPPLAGLDLNIADEEEFSPDKLRANIERLYMTIIVGMVAFGKHIGRLRSWRERNRTLGFMAVYFLAWLVDFLVPTIVAFLIILIVYPPSREYCFPPAPIALIDAKTGGVKKPAAGVLGSDDSLTGAPEKHQGEAVEQEASNFVNSFTTIAISSATGRHPEGDAENEADPSDGAPDPTDLVGSAVDAKDKTAGQKPHESHDKTKEPMAAAMWAKTRPIMHGIADVSDGWERFANALSPTPPFHPYKHRLKLASCLVPVLLISLFVTPYMFIKANGFILGSAFFGDPIIMKAAHYLNHEFPNWQKLLEIRNTLLKGVPTNAQLTITLLRIGEVNKAPLPPPPFAGDAPPPPNVAHATAGQDLDYLEDASDGEMADAIHPDATTATTTGSDAAPPKKKTGRRILNLIKGTTKGGIETMLGTDRLKAAAGVSHAQNRLGVLSTHPRDPSGPVDFPARYKGKRGHLYITTTATTPAVSWTNSKDNIDPVFSIAIQDIQELKKVGGFGWKTRLIVGWATNREIADGILIVDKDGNEKLLTAIALREELFNRLMSMGNQMWEAW